MRPVAFYRYDNRKRDEVLVWQAATAVSAAVAVLAALDPTRHTVIYLPNPTVGVRGIHHPVFQVRRRFPLAPPLSAVISSRSACG
jgi:hypothetical protein